MCGHQAEDDDAGRAQSSLQLTVPEWPTCDATLLFLRMKGGTGAGTHRCPRTELSEAGAEGVSRLDPQHPYPALWGRLG